MAGMIMNVASGRRGTYKPGRIRDRNLESIIYAAEKEFVKNGFRGTTIQTIADRAGLPKSNVRYYFGSKEKLYLAVLNDIMTIWNEQLGLIDDNDDNKKYKRTSVREDNPLAPANTRGASFNP